MKRQWVVVMASAFVLAACNPTIRVEGGEKPMEINLNIKHEILIKVEKDIENILNDDELF